MKRKKSILSLFLSFVLIASAVIPNTALTAYAAGDTLKEKIAESKGQDDVIEAKFLNKLDIDDIPEENISFSSTLADDNDAAKWSNDENEKSDEKESLGGAINHSFPIPVMLLICQILLETNTVLFFCSKTNLAD